MKTKHILFMAGTLVVLASCTHETVVYRPKPAPEVRTVYRTRTVQPSATLPGQASRIAEPGAASSFRATNE